MKLEFDASIRNEQGTGASRRLRRNSRIPGIVYGGSAQPAVIVMDHNELYHKLKLEAFHSSILTANIDGTPEPVLLRDVQMHAYKPIVLHLDFQRVDASQPIHVKVPLHFVNAEIAPGVKLHGAIASHVMTEIDVECLPADLPEYIEVDLQSLAVGDSLHVSNLVMPKGVAAALHRGDDPVVVSIVMPRGATATEEEADAAVSAAASAASAPAPAAPAAAAKK